MWLTNIFLGGDFLTFGIDVITFSKADPGEITGWKLKFQNISIEFVFHV